MAAATLGVLPARISAAMFLRNACLLADLINGTVCSPSVIYAAFS
jgi:hypothetical protein